MKQLKKLASVMLAVIIVFSALGTVNYDDEIMPCGDFMIEHIVES